MNPGSRFILFADEPSKYDLSIRHLRRNYVLLHWYPCYHALGTYITAIHRANQGISGTYDHRMATCIEEVRSLGSHISGLRKLTRWQGNPPGDRVVAIRPLIGPGRPHYVGASIGIPRTSAIPIQHLCDKHVAFVRAREKPHSQHSWIVRV